MIEETDATDDDCKLLSTVCSNYSSKYIYIFKFTLDLFFLTNWYVLLIHEIRETSVNWLSRINYLIMAVLACIRICFAVFIVAVDISHKISKYTGWRNVTNCLLTFLFSFTLRILERKKKTSRKTKQIIEFLSRKLIELAELVESFCLQILTTALFKWSN